MEEGRTIQMLKKLKAQEKRPNPLRLSKEMKVININDVTRNLTNEQLKISRLLNELEAYEKSVVDGKYLNYYKNLKDKREEFLQVTKGIDPAFEKKAPLFYQKIILKRKELLKKTR